jgi:hypothetical protein
MADTISWNLSSVMPSSMPVSVIDGQMALALMP